MRVTAFTDSGYFWLPGDDDQSHQVAGTLAVSETGVVTLETFGLFVGEWRCLRSAAAWTGHAPRSATANCPTPRPTEPAPFAVLHTQAFKDSGESRVDRSPLAVPDVASLGRALRADMNPVRGRGETTPDTHIG